MEKNKAHQTSQGFSRIRTRILALTLSILTLFTAIPTTAYAEDSVGGNISGGGKGGMGASSDYKAWSSDDQGYRFYLVDGNFNRVTDVYDYIYSMPDNIGDEYYTTRFDTASSPQGHIVMDISRLAELTNQSVSSIPKPVHNNKGQGKEFKAWFLKNLKTTGGSGGLYAGSSGSHKGSGSSSSSSGSSSGSSPSSGTTYTTYMDIPESIRDDITKSFQKLKDPYEYAPGLKDLNTKRLYDVMGDELSTATSAYLSFIGMYNKVYNATNRVLTADMLKRAAAMQLSKNGYQDFTVSYIYKNTNITSVLKVKEEQSLLFSSIPLATSDTEYNDTSTLNCPALLFLNNKEAIQVPGYSSAMEALVKGGYNIVYEPITWLYVNEGGVGYETRKTYGTYENILRKWVTHSGKPSKSFYHSYMGSLGNNCLVLSQDYISEDSTRTLKGITSEDSRLTTESLNLIDSGYGLSMHMLCSSDFDSSTHTYDSLLGTNPGMAPDPSTLPDEPAKGGNTITIIKNYVTEVNGTEQTDGNYKRKQNPHTIEIEDEPKYKVVDWNTSTGEAPDITNGFKLPWNDLIKTSTKTQVGNSSTAVELSKPEKVLYIKLKKVEGSSGNPEVAGDWELNESELTKAVSSKQATIFFA